MQTPEVRTMDTNYENKAEKDSCHCSTAGNSRSEYVKLLGITVDAALSFKTHVDKISKTDRKTKKTTLY